MPMSAGIRLGDQIPWGLSACLDFAANLAGMAMGADSPEGLGHQMIKDAFEKIVPLSSTEGFENELWSGGQGLSVGRHIYGGAGGYLLTGNSAIALGYSPKDAHQYLDKGNWPQRLAEIRGNIAGARVGSAMRLAMDLVENDTSCETQQLGKQLAGLAASILCTQ